MDNSTLFLLLIGNIILSLVVGWAATQRGRGSMSWFFLSLFISPILALLVLMVVGAEKKKPDSMADYLTWKRAQAAAPAAAVLTPVTEAPSILKTAVRRTSDGAEFQLNISEIRSALADGALSMSDYYFDFLARTWLELAAHPRLG